MKWLVDSSKWNRLQPLWSSGKATNNAATREDPDGNMYFSGIARVSFQRNGYRRKGEQCPERFRNGWIAKLTVHSCQTGEIRSFVGEYSMPALILLKLVILVRRITCIIKLIMISDEMSSLCYSKYLKPEWNVDMGTRSARAKYSFDPMTNNVRNR